MPRRGDHETRAGLPASHSVVDIKTLTPRGELSAAPMAGASLQTYRILRTTEVDGYDTPIRAMDVPAIGAAPAAPVSDDFAGTARKKAKLSLSSAPTESFDDLSGLVGDLPSDQSMGGRVPPIATASTSGRVAEEKRNVRLPVFLYAASREDDNDFHLIVGESPDAAQAVYMTVELSGLPSSRSRSHAALKRARDAFKAFFGSDLPGMSYDFYDPPIPLVIEGSLFFDMSHLVGGKPGPSSLRDDIPTIWEIHPISEIVFEPQENQP